MLGFEPIVLICVCVCEDIEIREVKRLAQGHVASKSFVLPWSCEPLHHLVPTAIRTQGGHPLREEGQEGGLERRSSCKQIGLWKQLVYEGGGVCRGYRHRDTRQLVSGEGNQKGNSPNLSLWALAPSVQVAVAGRSLVRPRRSHNLPLPVLFPMVISGNIWRCLEGVEEEGTGPGTAISWVSAGCRAALMGKGVERPGGGRWKIVSSPREGLNSHPVKQDTSGAC